MARSDDLGKGEVSPKRPGPVENSVKSDRAEKKPRLSRVSSRKRALSEVEETDTGVEESEDVITSRNAIRVEGEKHSGGKEAESSKRPISLRKWKRVSKSSSEHEEGSSARAETGKQSKEYEVVRKVLQTVNLSENCGDEETVEEDLRREKKRRGSHDSKQPEKKPRIDRTGAGVGTWRRLKWQKANPTAAEDMGVSVSEAWKRLREEKDSGSSVNGRSDSDLSMRSSDSEVEEERTKKARHDLPPPSQGRRWMRKSRERKESTSSKRLRDGGCESSSGSDNAHSSYYHNRKWKRPRFEYMMSMPWRRQSHEAGRENGRKRVQDDASEKPPKRLRK